MKKIFPSCRITSPFVSLVMLVMTSLTVGAAEPIETLRITTDVYCPYTCAENASERGVLVDIVAEILLAEGIQVDYRVMPWERAKHSVETGNADIVLGISKRTTSNLLINNEALFFDETVLVWRHGEGKPYSGTGALDEARIGVGAANVFDDDGELDQYLEMRAAKQDKLTMLFDAESSSAFFQMLVAGRIDMFPDNAQVIEHLVKSTSNENAVDIVETGKGNYLYLGFTQNEKGRKYSQLIDDGLNRLHASGRMTKILEKYNLNTRPKTIPLPGFSGD